MTEEHLETKKHLSVQDALKRIYKYCAYQERTQQEVRDKLYSLGLHHKDVEQTISLLITGGFLNEERFAISFAGGKFRIKQWGKVKIRYALKQKKISEYCIKKALSQISDYDYNKTMNEVLEDYARKLKEKNPLKRKYRIALHAVSRGFESELVWEVLQNENF